MISRAYAHKCLCGPALGVGLLFHNGKSADFGSISRNDTAHQSPFSIGALVYNQLPSASPIWLETYGRVGHAIVLHSAIRLR